MILIGLGSNLSDGHSASPRSMLAAALAEMPAWGIDIVALSHFYESEPVPKSDQPWFINAVAAVDTRLSPEDLLNVLHDIETKLGRTRRIRWEARIIDLDIIAYDDRICPSPDDGPGDWHNAAGDGYITHQVQDMVIPHPRMHERLFVLNPLMDICPEWIHPVFGKTAKFFARELAGQENKGLIRQI
ncbi:MAG: 2-amino-4-hydroxy-6-hydroxymethyldihydropteridine diphosphokinase [Alphaproteobacteria bacterium]|nr:MAG: 2-amino-4-hydroxy-6-hydroxymethyldihydropteridine diphosphokinase [Alphaproteobacteria bacterium]